MALATFMRASRTKIVWTTNFDPLVADACAKVYDGTGHLTTVALDAPDLARDVINGERWPAEIKLHGDFRSAVRMTARLLPAMRAAQWGRIINISSMAALMTPAKRPDYGAAKAAMIAMTASLAKEVAMDGITANTVSPGTIKSDRLDEGFRKVAAAQGLALDAPWTEIEKIVLPMFA